MTKSYYFDQDKDQWVELIRGAKGETGPRGPEGPMGPKGELTLLNLGGVPPGKVDLDETVKDFSHVKVSLLASSPGTLLYLPDIGDRLHHLTLLIVGQQEEGQSHVTLYNYKELGNTGSNSLDSLLYLYPGGVGVANLSHIPEVGWLVLGLVQYSSSGIT